MNILLFSLEQGALGGIASVNATLKPALERRGHRVSELFLCRAENAQNSAGTALRDTPWHFPEGRAIKTALLKGKILSAARLFAGRIAALRHKARDDRRARRFIEKEAPDAILVTHYLLLSAVPQAYRSRTFLHVHTSFSAACAVKKGEQVMRRFSGKIGFLWLSRATAEQAEKAGFAPSFYAYNPLPFEQGERVLAEENRDVVILTRFSAEKRLDLAVSLLKQAMDRRPERPFCVRFYGEGPEKDRLSAAIGDDARFAVLPRTDDVQKAYAGARFSVNTSSFEGFPMSVLESAAVGVPTVSFVFGEAAKEEILSGKTGLLAPMDDTAAFLSALDAIIESDDLCRALSVGAYAHAARFQADSAAAALEAILSEAPLDKA